ncbi:MAG: 2-oxoacid:acceptor oxidoreductase subunit alpha [Deltaproteobacteria bacterium]|nr:2-oxoacid:acceptor oxidoreductase subunit alpha [Deltaproteobacteria bacterium]
MVAPYTNDEQVSRITVRIAGDSGDGVQLAGAQLSTAAAFAGNDISTLPDFPAEIRAPAGSLAGVSSFQVSFSSENIFTPGDAPDVLVALNPAALKVHLPALPKGATLIVDGDAFSAANLRKAGYEQSPLDDASLAGYRVLQVPISSVNQRALDDSGLTRKEINRCRNFFALGLLHWMHGRALEDTIGGLRAKFSARETLAAANIAALKAGHAFGETIELAGGRQLVPRAPLQPGLYRTVTGNTAMALGLIAAAKGAAHPLFYASYPITPASDLLHELARHKHMGVRTFQAEDEIAAMGAVVGAAYGGAIAVTGTSGPGLALKSEALGLAVMTELPVIVINVQRAGPSTGMPTKTEQADLLQAAFGRNGESPLVVLAPASPADAFAIAVEAVRIATTFMTPVVVLSDGYLASSSEPWRIPQGDELKRVVSKLQLEHPTTVEDFAPYARDSKTLARPWVLPGTPGLEHRIGSLEKAEGSGHVSYDPQNHHRMSCVRAEKVQRVADTIEAPEIFGDPKGELLAIGWGSSFGAIRTAVQHHQREGHAVSQLHLRHLSPLPHGLAEIFNRFTRVLLPEGNLGQLLMLLRDELHGELRGEIKGYNRVTGQPFSSGEIYTAITDELERGGA